MYITMNSHARKLQTSVLYNL